MSVPDIEPPMIDTNRLRLELWGLHRCTNQEGLKLPV